jgi:hypothetical protein
MTLEIIMSINIVALVGGLFAILYWGVKCGKVLGEVTQTLLTLSASNRELWEKKVDKDVCEVLCETHHDIAKARSRGIMG